MNAATRLSVVDAAPQRIEAFHTAKLDNYDWQVRFGYRVTQVGTPNSCRCFECDPNADGTPTEVSIVRAWLLDSGGNELPVPLSFFPLDLLVEHETEIASEIDDE